MMATSLALVASSPIVGTVPTTYTAVRVTGLALQFLTSGPTVQPRPVIPQTISRIDFRWLVSLRLSDLLPTDLSH